MPDGLTPKQQRFVEEYLVDLNATQAAIRAGYSAKTANEQGSRLLAHVSIASAVQSAIAARSERTQVTADRVVAELAKIGFSDMRKFSTWGPAGVMLRDSETLQGEDAACVAEVSQTITDGGGGTLKFKLHDKVTSLKLLGQHVGMFKGDTDPDNATPGERYYVILGGQKVPF
jgi:phage terminase small subunit